MRPREESTRMNTENIPLSSNRVQSAKCVGKNRILQFSTATRVGAILLLVGLLVSSFYLTSFASHSEERRPITVAPEATRLAISDAKAGAHSILSSLTLPNSALLLPKPQAAPPETLAIYASDCTTPKTNFLVGDTVCVRVSGAPLIAFFPRHLTWSTTDSTIVHATDITTDPQTDSLLITPTTIINGQTIDNRGTWE